MNLTDHGLEAADVKNLNDAQLVQLIRTDWPTPWFGAVPYLDAMESLTFANPETGLRDAYGYDSPGEAALYFGANAATWKGETAREVKKELKRRG